eukprot:1666886-Rhodomonas_salina.1
MAHDCTDRGDRFDRKIVNYHYGRFLSYKCTSGSAIFLYQPEHFVQPFAFSYLHGSSHAHAVTIPEVDYVTEFARQRFDVPGTLG